MAHLPTLSADQIAHAGLAEMFRASGDEMFGVYGHAPEAFAAFLAFYRPLKYGGQLPFGLKELVRLRIAALNGCHR